MPVTSLERRPRNLREELVRALVLALVEELSRLADIDPSNPDRGTAFRPDKGWKYVKKLLKRWGH